MPQVFQLDRNAVEHFADVADPRPRPASPRPKPQGPDALVACIEFFARLMTKPLAAHAITAGLPLEDGRLTPQLFERAAERAGLTARRVELPIGEISALALPAVLLLTDGEAVVLLKAPRAGRARIFLPRSGGERKVRMSEIARLYAGTAILVARAYRFESRTANEVIAEDRHWFLGALGRTWGIYAEVMVATFLINLFALAIPFFSMIVYDRVVPNRVLETLWVLAIGATLVVVFDLAMRTLRGYFIDVAGRRIDIGLSGTIFQRVMGLEMSARPPSVGAFASRLADFDAIREFITSATISTLIDVPFALLFIVAIFWIGGPLGWVVLGAAPVILALSLLMQVPLARLVRETARMSAQRQATLIESLVGLETVKVMGAEGVVQRKWEEVVRAIARNGLRSRLLSSTAVNFATFAQQIAFIAVIVYGVYLIGEDQLSVGGLIAASLLTGRALAPLGQVAALLTRWHQSRTALVSIDMLMKLPVERPASREFVERPRLRGMIEFRNVSFAYPNAKVDALSDVSFRVMPGERVGIIGRIGSGKSTLERLILGLYPPKSGAVLVDGVDVRQLDPLALRRDIGYVPQDTVLFYGTIRDNIAIGAPHANDQAILRAAEMAGVTAFTDQTPNGFDAQVGERGEMLSGGQRQAISIARAELLAPPVLILDEPTSAMDNRTEELFRKRLALQLGRRTLLIVTHRASMLDLVNRLIVIDHGRVLADGPKDAVLRALSGKRA